MRSRGAGTPAAAAPSEHPNDPDRVPGTPRVFHGRIASGNKLFPCGVGVLGPSARAEGRFERSERDQEAKAELAHITRTLRRLRTQAALQVRKSALIGSRGR